MQLPGVHEERVDEVDVAGQAGRERDGQALGGRHRLSGEREELGALLPVGREQPGRRAVRPHPDLRGRVRLANLGEQEQHQQGATP
ncbi:hypothetical protein ACFQH9_10525 [Pseudonocardia lutea]|uniref:Uncharacterized protein n=1 Tax=Pseudonocardia lutea TaxID=2172015 RepID=A0ABW1I7D6_9PSEU